MTDTKDIVEGLLGQLTPVAFRAGGPSMNPIIRDGESVRIRPLQAGDLRLGSVVLCRKTGRLVLHRMIRRKPNGDAVYIVADAALAGGDWVAKTDILGIAEWVRRGERIYRLDGARNRLSGMARYGLRPLRRALSHLRPADHAHAPADRP